MSLTPGTEPGTNGTRRPLDGCYSIGEWHVNPELRRVERDGRVTHLEPKVMEVLLCLIEAKGRIASREQLIHRVWQDAFVTDDVVKRCIWQLRRAFEDDPKSPRVFETIPKGGYRLMLPIRSGSTADGAAVLNSESRLRLGKILISSLTVVAIAIGITVSLRLQNRASRKLAQYDVVPLITLPGMNSGPAFSPDGSQIAFIQGINGPSGPLWGDLFVETLSDEKALHLATLPGVSSCPSWSPDGQWIAYTHRVEKTPGKGESAIFLISPLGGGNRKIKETPFGGCTVDWSPDGTLIAYEDAPVGQGTGMSGVFLLSTSDYSARRLTTPPGSTEDGTPAFSRDGKRIAFVRQSSWGVNDIYIVDIAGGEPRRLTFMNANLGRPIWTSDDQRIIFWAGTGGSGWVVDLYSIASNGGKPERLGFSNYDAAGPAITRRGDKLAYMRCNVDINIWKTTIGQPSEPPSKFAASSSRPDLDPEFSPDGSKVAFESDRDGELAIWISDADGRNATKLAPAWQGGSPRWSPDASQIAFDDRRDGHAHIAVVDVVGGRPRRLTDGDSDDVVPSWSVDGKWIYFGSLRTGSWEIWRSSTTTKESFQVTHHGGMVAQTSSDGHFVYYSKPEYEHVTYTLPKPGIWRVPVDGGAEELVNADMPGPWHVTGSGIYFPDNAAKPHPILKFFEFGSKSIKPVAPLDKGTWGPPNFAVSRNGRDVLYTQSDGGGCGIYLVKDAQW